MSYYSSPQHQQPPPYTSQQQQQLHPYAMLPPPPPVPRKKPLSQRVLNNVFPPLMGFGMGMFVGGSVVMLHFAMSNRRMLFTKEALKAAGSSGAAFGCIFAVGSLFRPQ